MSIKILLNSKDRVNSATSANDCEFRVNWGSILDDGKYRLSYSICKQLVPRIFPAYNTISPLGLELYYPFTSSTLNADGVRVGNLATGNLVYDSSLTGISTITNDSLSTPAQGTVLNGLVINRTVTAGAVATLSFWFKCTSIPRGGYWFITAMQSGVARFIITIDPSNKILINSTGPFTWLSTMNVVVNTTYHVVVVLNNGTNSLYINGVFNSSGNASVPVNTAGINSIMRDPGGGLGMIGIVDDYRYYSRAITLPEIATLASIPP